MNWKKMGSANKKVKVLKFTSCKLFTSTNQDHVNSQVNWLVWLFAFLAFKKGFYSDQIRSWSLQQCQQKSWTNFPIFCFCFCCTFLARLLDRDFDWEGQEYGLFLVAFAIRPCPQKVKGKKKGFEKKVFLTKKINCFLNFLSKLWAVMMIILGRLKFDVLKLFSSWKRSCFSITYF